MNLELMCLTRFGHVRTGLLVLALSSVAGIAALPTSSSLSDAQMSRIVGKDGEPCSQVVPNDECKPYTNACATCQDRLIDAGGEPACPTDDGHIYTIKSGNTFQVCDSANGKTGKICSTVGTVNCMREYKCKSNAVTAHTRCAGGACWPLDEGDPDKNCRTCTTNEGEGPWSTRTTKTCL